MLGVVVLGVVVLGVVVVGVVEDVVELSVWDVCC